ncbi:S8 family serine peptidase [Natronorubrum tibetense]|uniref:Peptidase S8/S53 subtilisin kexin sedolisin n=1 Tax=Natronorubrum tibetense GA33 TaxID=1114856 RepID=L9W8W5_9EURY|nr:S8 family serine peptidase [Natronorubrum tibetense]ELY45889.1 peptidase S8/S53 subtilisin kexin sedolisin [Natronorubrum tibetense GA33]
MAAHRAVPSAGTVRILTVALVCLLLTTALLTPALAASSGFERTAVDGDRTSAVQLQKTADPADAAIYTDVEDSIKSANGTIEVVLRLEEATIPADATEAEAERLLETHAAETQESLLEHVADTPGVDVESEFWLTNAVLLEIDADRIDLETLEILAAVDPVEAVHENFELSVPEEPTVDGTSSTAEMPVDGDEISGTTQLTTPGIAQLNAPAVWESYDTRGDGVRVAVLDTGVDADHPSIDLYTEDPSDPTYPGGWAEFDAAGERVEGSTPYDSGTHGTHVSGTVAGNAASGAQIGVAPDAELLHGLVLNETSGSFAQIIAGMEWALEEEADVISMSLGATGTHSPLIDPVQNAVDSGAVVVAAIGNDGEETSNSPGNVYEAISVGAVHTDGTVASFSGGETINRSDWTHEQASWPSSYVVPDVVAHGVAVFSAVPGGGYQPMPGTSMATPHVSGTVALMLSAEPDATAEEISTALYGTTWKPDGADADTMDTRYGHGIVDAKAATNALVDTREAIDTDSADGTTETESKTTAPYSQLFAAGVSVIVVFVAAVALVAARSVSRETER